MFKAPLSTSLLRKHSPLQWREALTDPESNLFMAILGQITQHPWASDYFSVACGHIYSSVNVIIKIIWISTQCIEGVQEMLTLTIASIY